MKAYEIVIKFFSDTDLKVLEAKVNFYLEGGIEEEHPTDFINDEYEYIDLKFTQTDREYSAVLVLRIPCYE